MRLSPLMKHLLNALVLGIAARLGPPIAGEKAPLPDVAQYHISEPPAPDAYRFRRSSKSKSAAKLKREAQRRRNIEKRKPKWHAE